MLHLRHLVPSVATTLFASVAAAQTPNYLNFLSGTAGLPIGGEIVSYSSASAQVLVTNSGGSTHGVSIYGLGATGALGFERTVDLSGIIGASGAATLSLSSVAADPLGRGFGVATLIPTANDATLGKIAFFDLGTGAVLQALDVGYHPDHVSFTPDGSRLLIANEAENSTATQRAGSVSIVDLASVSTAGGLGALSQATHVRTVDFSGANLGTGVSIDGLRNTRDTLTTSVATGQRHLDVEPEFITSTNTTAYITLQENNAVAVLDLASGTYTAVHELGVIQQRIDGSERDGAGGGGSIKIDDTVATLPMPDTIVQFERAGQTLLVTANEGDFRADNADRARLRDIRNTLLEPALASTSLVDNAVLGRLRVSTIDGDTDGNGKIDRPTLTGSRSFSLWDAATGQLVFDSGSAIEEFVAANYPATFNLDFENTDPATRFDGRSDDKGPEIESVAYGAIGGRDYIFVGAERQNGIFMFDVTDLSAVAIVGYFNAVSDPSFITGTSLFISPESIKFLAADSNPTGKNLLLVGYEGVADGMFINGSVAVIEITAPIPEPATWAALAGAAALGLAVWRRRAVRR